MHSFAADDIRIINTSDGNGEGETNTNKIASYKAK